MGASYLSNPGNQVVKSTVGSMYDDRQGKFLTHAHLSPIDKIFRTAQIEGVRNLSFLIGKAEEARRHALSYRNFLVGAAAMAVFYNPATNWPYEFITGANAKPLPEIQ